MIVSLILPTFKRPELLQIGLESISNQIFHYDLEIVILNDGIEDETETICKKFSNLNIRYYFTGQRNKNEIIWRCPGYAINIGVKKCLGNIIILSCPEMFHCSIYNFQNIVDSLKMKSNVFVTPTEIIYDDTGDILNKVKQQQKIDYNNFIIRTKESDASRMPYFMAMWKESFLNINGYDERMVGYCADDNDFVDRLTINNERIKVKLPIIHLYHGKVSDCQCHFENPAWVINWNIYQENKKMKIVKVNLDKEWGVI